MEPLWIILLFVITLAIPAWRKEFFLLDDTFEKPATPSVKRDPFFDFLKGVAILAVLFIHVTYFFPDPTTERQQHFLWLVNNLGRFAIPLFFICSGALLSPESSSRGWWSGFWKAKISRLLIPYILVSALILGWRHVSFGEAARGIVTGGFIVPFYFIVILFQFYLIYPWLLKIKNYRWFLPAALTVSLCAYLYSPVGQWHNFPLFFQYLFFFAYGLKGRGIFLQAKRDGAKDSFFMWTFLAGMTLVLFIFWPAKYFNNQYFFGPAVFNLLFLFRGSRGWGIRSLTWIGERSFWIFLVHFSLIGIVFQALSLAGEIDFHLHFIVFLLCGSILSIMMAAVLYYGYGKVTRPLVFKEK